MKNITLSIEDEIYRKARIKAAEEGTSVSSLVKGFLVKLVASAGKETEFQRLQREEQELREELCARNIGLNATHHVSRAELHDRYALH